MLRLYKQLIIPGLSYIMPNRHSFKYNYKLKLVTDFQKKYLIYISF